MCLPQCAGPTLSSLLPLVEVPLVGWGEAYCLLVTTYKYTLCGKCDIRKFQTFSTYTCTEISWQLSLHNAILVNNGEGRVLLSIYCQYIHHTIAIEYAADGFVSKEYIHIFVHISLLHLEYARYAEVSWLLRVRIVGVNDCRRYVCCISQIDHWICSLISLHSKSYFLILCQWVVTWASSIQCIVIAWLKTLEYEDTVVIVIHLVACYLYTRFLQDNLSTVTWYPLVVGLRGIGEQAVVHLVVLVLNSTYDITSSFFLSTIVIDNSAVIVKTLHVAVVLVQRTVTSWLAGVEIALREETTSTMLHYAQVTLVCFAIDGKATMTAVEVPVTTDIQSGRRSYINTCLHDFEFLLVGKFSFLVATLYIFSSIYRVCATIVVWTTIKHQWEVCSATLRVCIRVYRDKVVHVILFYLAANFA